MDIVEMGVVDVDKQKLITLDTSKLKNCMTTKYKWSGKLFKESMCHITNFRYKQDIFNGIFGIVGEDNVCYPYLCLYDPFIKETKHQFLSTQHLTPKHAAPKQFLYLSDKQCIIYHWKGKLYQLPLDNNIGVGDDLSKFVEIKAQNRINMKFNGPDTWLQMVYLPDQQYLMGVKCYRKKVSTHSNKSMRRLTAGRIFDINEQKWNQIEYYKHWSMRKDRFETRALCYDNQNRIYMIDMENNICYYDLDDLKWTNIKQLDSMSTNGCTWMSNHHILYRFEVDSANSCFILKSLDLLKENIEWVKESTVDVEIKQNLNGISLHQQPYAY